MRLQSVGRRETVMISSSRKSSFRQHYVLTTVEMDAVLDEVGHENWILFGHP